MLGFTPVQETRQQVQLHTALLRSRKGGARAAPCRTSRRKGRKTGIVSTVPDNISVRSAMPVPPAVPRRMTRGVCASGRWSVPQLSSCCSSTSFIRSSPMCSCAPVRRRHRPNRCHRIRSAQRARPDGYFRRESGRSSLSRWFPTIIRNKWQIRSDYYPKSSPTRLLRARSSTVPHRWSRR